MYQCLICCRLRLVDRCGRARAGVDVVDGDAISRVARPAPAPATCRQRIPLQTVQYIREPPAGFRSAGSTGFRCEQPKSLQLPRGPHVVGGGRSAKRHTFSFYDPDLDEQLQTRRALTADLRSAIEHREFTLHYQKLFAANGTDVTGYEALLRWTHPKLGNVSPDVFIPLAEDSGFIEQLGSWVLGEACREAASWPNEQSIAVNLSAVQFRQGDLLETVRGALSDSGLTPSRLELEITESLLMSDTDHVIQKLTALTQLGVHIAMDDFGTGYSSLAYLWRFPFHKLKIDKSFTQAMEGDDKVGVIVKSIISLAHSLSIRVNAEGVETENQLALLKSHGCDEFQGFLLGRPASADSLPHRSDLAIGDSSQSLPTQGQSREIDEDDSFQSAA